MGAAVVVIGQIARDLVIGVGQVPGPGRSADVRVRRELRGGKGANQAVGLAQLGESVGLVGVVGDDAIGEELLICAAADEVDVSSVVRRSATSTALIVDVVEADGRWRYFEDIPDQTLLTERDVAEASKVIGGATSVVVQLQQPFDSAFEAARLGRAGGARVVLDGAPRDTKRLGDLLAQADVVRADATEAEMLAARPLRTEAAVVDAGVRLLDRGPSLVVLELAGEGNVFVNGNGHEFLPHARTEQVDTTGSGDALVAALTAALTDGAPLHSAARLAVAAAAATTEHVGGRPRLTADILDRMLESYP